MPALASTMDERVSVMKSEDTTCREGRHRSTLQTQNTQSMTPASCNAAGKIAHITGKHFDTAMHITTPCLLRFRS